MSGCPHSYYDCLWFPSPVWWHPSTIHSVSTLSLHGSGGLVAKSCPTLVTPWSVACQYPLSMGFSRQEYWSGLPFPSPEDLPNPGMEPGYPAWQADSLLTELREKPHVSAGTYAKLLNHVTSLRPYEPYRLPGSLVQGVLQARVLEWVATSSSRVSSQPRDQTLISYVSCIGRWDLYTGITWEVLSLIHSFSLRARAWVSNSIGLVWIIWSFQAP